MVLVSLLSYMLAGLGERGSLDDSLYRYQLAGDVWRVSYLRGHFEDFSFSKGNNASGEVQKDFERIYNLTGLCTYLGGIRVTSCPGESAAVRIVSINRVLYENGSATNATLMIGKG